MEDYLCQLRSFVKYHRKKETNTYMYMNGLILLDLEMGFIEKTTPALTFKSYPYIWNIKLVTSTSRTFAHSRSSFKLCTYL